MAELYLKFKSHFDEESGVKTPTNFKSFTSLTSINSENYDARNDDIHSSIEDTSSCETPIHKSFSSSPIDDVSFISGHTENQASVSYLTKVFRCLYINKIIINFIQSKIIKGRN